jgi:hypothetical protein
MAEKKYLVEYTEWLDAELTRRYKTSQTMAGKSRGRNALSDTEGGGISSNEYNGYFKVIWDNVVDDAGNVTQRRIKIINGGNPESRYAGDTDAGLVPVTQIKYTKAGSIYLIAKYSDNNFVFEFAPQKPDTEKLNTAWVKIADVSDENINQVWTSGQVYFGERYFMP